MHKFFLLDIHLFISTLFLQRVFSSKSSLKLHMRSHQANKRFKCDKCEYEANDHNAFRRHLATHREPKRYACPHCDFRAIQSTAYRVGS